MNARAREVGMRGTKINSHVLLVLLSRIPALQLTAHRIYDSVSARYMFTSTHMQQKLVTDP